MQQQKKNCEDQFEFIGGILWKEKNSGSYKLLVVLFYGLFWL